MAKKKDANGGSERVSVTTLKGSRDWAEWLSRFADYRRVSLAALIDMALAEHAKSTGFNENPPKR
jgi:hypothetical protein